MDSAIRAKPPPRRFRMLPPSAVTKWWSAPSMMQPVVRFCTHRKWTYKGKNNFMLEVKAEGNNFVPVILPVHNICALCDAFCNAKQWTLVASSSSQQPGVERGTLFLSVVRSHWPKAIDQSEHSICLSAALHSRGLRTRRSF